MFTLGGKGMLGLKLLFKYNVRVIFILFLLLSTSVYRSKVPSFIQNSKVHLTYMCMPHIQPLFSLNKFNHLHQHLKIQALSSTLKHHSLLTLKDASVLLILALKEWIHSHLAAWHTSWCHQKFFRKKSCVPKPMVCTTACHMETIFYPSFDPDSTAASPVSQGL